MSQFFYFNFQRGCAELPPPPPAYGPSTAQKVLRPSYDDPSCAAARNPAKLLATSQSNYPVRTPVHTQFELGSYPARATNQNLARAKSSTANYIVLGRPTTRR